MWEDGVKWLAGLSTGEWRMLICIALFLIWVKS